MPTKAPASNGAIPRGDGAGFVKYLRQDMLSGFLVFLIALPLCLGIALACGYPAIAGIFTAIIGAFVTTFISNSELTIKGPAAGLIVIAVGCVADFGGDGAIGGFSDLDMSAYQAALAVGVVAAILQVVFGLFRAGILGDFFPLSAVHGMLAAIGVIIVLKQFPVALGVDASGEPLELLRELPHLVTQANPAIAAIGATSLLIMFLWPVLQRRVTGLKVVPSPIIVLLVAVPMGMGFDLLHEHSFTLQGHQYSLSDQYLVRMPDRPFGMFSEFAFPDFGALSQVKAWKWVFMFFMIGSLESLLSAKAIDMLDPWKRKTSLDRDMVAVGVANLGAALVGGLPMISEIVRSKANIDNGARTRFADLWHGFFLLVCVALIPTVLHRIPLAALAAMLVYTGYRLAHPTEFVNVYKIGREQLLIFLVTLVAVLATDLLIGIAIGILTKVAIHLVNGVPLRSMLKPYLVVEPLGENTCVVHAHESAVFSNWIPFRRQLEDIGLLQRQNVTVDLASAKLVDHSVMEKLHLMQEDFRQEGLELSIIGLESHEPVSSHELAARRQTATHMRCLTAIVAQVDVSRLEQVFLEHEADYAVVECQRPGPGGSEEAAFKRLEAIVHMDECEALLSDLRGGGLAHLDVMVWVAPIDAVYRNSGMTRDPAEVGL